MISLSLIMRLIMSTMTELTHTASVQPIIYTLILIHTLFTDQRIIAVVGVIRIASCRATAIGKGTDIEFCSLSVNLA